MADRICVLFVDDEPSVLRAIKRTLIDAPIEVLTAFDAASALAILAARPVDVLVSDIDMPGMSGLELIAVARRLHPRTLRMLLSGQSTLHRALQAINEGEVVRFFPKPFDPSAFRSTIESLANRIAQMRRDGGEVARAARRDEVHEWIEERFPGATRVEVAADGVVDIDLSVLRATLATAGGRELLFLLGDSEEAS